MSPLVDTVPRPRSGEPWRVRAGRAEGDTIGAGKIRPGHEGGGVAASYTTRDRQPDGTARLDVEGDLDLTTRSALVGHVDRLLGDAAVTGIVIDVSAVEFIDSSCIGALVGCKLNAEKTGRTLRVQGARGQVDEVFEMTGVTAILTAPPSS